MRSWLTTRLWWLRRHVVALALARGTKEGGKGEMVAISLISKRCIELNLVTYTGSIASHIAPGENLGLPHVDESWPFGFASEKL